MARPRVVIAGVSVRAAAEAAHAAGFDCLAVDAFGDLDLQRFARTSVALRRDLGRPYSAAAAAAAALRLDADLAAYVGNLENHPAAVARLARGRTLLGNSPATLVPARDPRALGRVARRAGARLPRTLFEDAIVPARGSWLSKPRRGGGGSGIVPARPGSRVPRGRVVQQRIDGLAGSVSFLADGRRARLIGFAAALTGDAAFGGRGWRYCGSLFPMPLPSAAAERLAAVVEEATRTFGLVGLNGLDFVIRDESPYVLELNPRLSASMELLQRAGMADLFALHADACRGTLAARLPSFGPGVWGKAVLWADRELTVPDTRAWLARGDVRDVPRPGDRIRRGHPICTVLAAAPDVRACRSALVERARSLRATLALAEALPA